MTFEGDVAEEWYWEDVLLWKRSLLFDDVVGSFEVYEMFFKLRFGFVCDSGLDAYFVYKK